MTPLCLTKINRPRLLLMLLGIAAALFLFNPVFGQSEEAATAATDAAAAVTDAVAAPAADAAAAAPAAFNQEAADGLYLTKSTANIIWLMIAAFLVFFMQAGFALVETGLTRAKNSVAVCMKNLLDFCFGAVIFWGIGYAIMFSSGDANFLGLDASKMFLGASNAAGDHAQSAMWLFQVVFAATAATIVSGAMAERTKLVSYVLYSCAISAVIYPITGHWIWGGGWLGDLNMRDFAGSTVVHMVGGVIAFVGAWMVGPRLGKYGPDGKVYGIPGHNFPLAFLGVFILFFGWFGFNPGSTLLAIDGVAHVAVTTCLAGAAGAVSAYIVSWLQFGKPDGSMTLNGVLAGLVAITAPCASVSTVSAVIIGLVAGVLVIYSCLFIERTLKVDDPVGAVSVHGVCGAFGTLCVGLFGQRAIDVQYWSEETAIKDGLFFGGGFSQLGIQALGVGAVLAYVAVAALVVFVVIKAICGLRVSDQEQLEGLDLGEHGAEAYPDFSQAPSRLEFEINSNGNGGGEVAGHGAPAPAPGAKPRTV